MVIEGLERGKKTFMPSESGEPGEPRSLQIGKTNSTLVIFESSYA